MKKIVFLSALFFVVLTGYSQEKIQLSDVAKHIGDSVSIEFPLDEIKYMTKMKGKPALLHMGGKYPNQLLTLVIWEAVRKTFTQNLEDGLNRFIRVSGRLVLHKGKPQITIYKEAQLQLTWAEGVEGGR